MPADTLYETDIVAWAEQQARAIRDLARARPELSNALDWENVAEEIDTVGRSEARQVASLLRQFLIHLAKALSDPDSPSLNRWRAETAVFHADARDGYTSAMQTKIDVGRLWKEALKAAAPALADHGAGLAADLTKVVPLTLDELLEPELDLDRAIAIASERLGRNQSPVFPGA